MAGVEEELRDREVGLAQLLGGVATVGLEARRAWVRLGVRGDADREVAVLAHEADEIDRVVELARRQVEVLRRVAAEGQDVLDPGVAVAGDDLGELGSRVCAAQVRCAIAVIDVSRLISTTRSWVRSRVEPPAPYVTETYEGLSGSRRRSVRESTFSISSSRGGENSNE